MVRILNMSASKVLTSYRQKEFDLNQVAGRGRVAGQNPIRCCYHYAVEHRFGSYRGLANPKPDVVATGEFADRFIRASHASWPVSYKSPPESLKRYNGVAW